MGRFKIKFILVLFLGLCFSFPFLWMVLATFKDTHEIFTPFPLFPKKFQMTYYYSLWDENNLPHFTRQYLNSLWVAIIQTLGALAVSVPAGYLFSKFKFKGRTLLIVMTAFVILIPQQVLILPLFEWINTLKLYDNLLSVILPGMVTGIGVIYFYLVYQKFPQPILDTARTEGANEYKIFITTLALIKPAILSYALIHFIFAWHKHLLPLILLNTKENYTVTVSLSSILTSNAHVPYAVLMVGSTFMVLPTALVYFFLRKHFKSSLSELVSN